MRTILTSIRDGSFSSQLRDEYTAGFAKFREQRAAIAGHAIESAGETVRSLMPWLKDESPA
jgi:ketol-acid reductoisomerase